VEVVSEITGGRTNGEQDPPAGGPPRRASGDGIDGGPRLPGSLRRLVSHGVGRLDRLPGSVSSSNAPCVVTPQLTEGPYFVDEGLNRSDIRTDTATGAARPGLPLELTIALSQVGAGTCGPLAGALVDVWHCDALDVCSDVAQQRSVGQAFLRGHQVSDASGVVRFTTIYPCWYQGRAVHLHFKVRTSPTASRGLEVTSQMFFDEALTDVVHQQPPYSQKGRRDTLNSTDGIYRSGGPALLAPLAAAGAGYAGTFQVGVQA
jgi:protocatechuate 3,4-dioxygenase beta subunit